ncbi:hypothetical protein ACFR99_12800 [Haloarchaeobius amylolyticus]|uniref:Lipoprotein n=1 Tax=Haloarchaeobius amylolyticus TaxID=1198296 RepID=A0ABD6BIB2_9EURY
MFLTTGAIVALSGCSALNTASAQIARIRLENDDSSAHEFSLTIRVNGEIVYDETHLITAEENDSSIELTDEIPDERGNITIEITVEGTEITESATFDDDNCYDVIGEYTGDNLIIWQSGSDDGCDTFTAE